MAPKLLRNRLQFLLLKWGEDAVRKKFLGRRLIYAKYQEENLNLVKMNFRPFEEDWCRLSILALGLGVSRCLLFAILLELDKNQKLNRKTKFRGVPTRIRITRRLNSIQKKLTSKINLSRARPS